MILVDTSAWIEVLRGRAADRYAQAVAGDEVVTCLPVMQEVLQGIDDDMAFHVAAAAFADIPMLESPLTRSVLTTRYVFTATPAAPRSQCVPA